MRTAVRGRGFALTVFLGLLLGAPSLSAQAASIVDSNSGIDFRVRLTATPGVVSITWQVSSATLNQGANDFEIQFFVDGPQQWQPQVSTDEPTDNGFPVFIGGVPDLFCFRMVATQNGSGPILGSGTSGNEFPCFSDPPPPPPTAFTLTVSKAGSGEGTVTSVPAGVNCGADCSESYASGTSVTLTAVAAAGSQFAGWSGCSSTSGATCVRQMNANQVVTATFSKDCKSVAVAVLLGGPFTLPESLNAPHNVALTSIKTLALATGGDLVAAEFFTAGFSQISRVKDWLNDLSEGCNSPVPAVLVGHSLGGDGAIKVNYDKVCSRILLDAFDPLLLDRTTGVKFVQGRSSPRDAPSDGFVYSFLAEFPNVFQGRPLKNEPNVEQRCVRGSDHNSIVEAVVSSGAFQDSIVGQELSRCAAGSAAPAPPQFYERCQQQRFPMSPILDLLLRD